jgi:hypothetical protein
MNETPPTVPPTIAGVEDFLTELSPRFAVEVGVCTIVVRITLWKVLVASLVLVLDLGSGALRV